MHSLPAGSAKMSTLKSGLQTKKDFWNDLKYVEKKRNLFDRTSS